MTSCEVVRFKPPAHDGGGLAAMPLIRWQWWYRQTLAIRYTDTGADMASWHNSVVTVWHLPVRTWEMRGPEAIVIDQSSYCHTNHGSILLEKTDKHQCSECVLEDVLLRVWVWDSPAEFSPCLRWTGHNKITRITGVICLSVMCAQLTFIAKKNLIIHTNMSFKNKHQLRFFFRFFSLGISSILYLISKWLIVKSVAIMWPYIGP